MVFPPLLCGRKTVYKKAINISQWELCHSFNDRFAIYVKNGKIAFVDARWPSLIIYNDPGIQQFNAKQLRKLFYWGFCPPVTEFIPQQIAGQKYFPSHRNFWQYPCRTEQDAYERHLKLEKPVHGQRTAHTYIGLPWATWIDKKSMPINLLRLYGERLASIRSFLSGLGVTLHAHTVCQHVDWKLKRYIKSFELAGINQLWIAHKERGWDKERKIRLRSWPLYAVNALDPHRRVGIKLVPVEEKPIFASFKGAHMANYPSNIRLRLKELDCKEGYSIEVNDCWHFSDIVYNTQVENSKPANEKNDTEEVFTYNQLLSNSLFSLCPRGAGPNTLRLWESLAIGSIPVVLSDQYEFPSLEHMGWASVSWNEAVLTVPESDLECLNERLRALTQQDCQRLQCRGLQLFVLSKQLRCFGKMNKMQEDLEISP